MSGKVMNWLRNLAAFALVVLIVVGAVVLIVGGVIAADWVRHETVVVSVGTDFHLTETTDFSGEKSVLILRLERIDEGTAVLGSGEKLKAGDTFRFHDETVFSVKEVGVGTMTMDLPGFWSLK